MFPSYEYDDSKHPLISLARNNDECGMFQGGGRGGGYQSCEPQQLKADMPTCPPAHLASDCPGHHQIYKMQTRGDHSRLVSHL